MDMDDPLSIINNLAAEFHTVFLTRENVEKICQAVPFEFSNLVFSGLDDNFEASKISTQTTLSFVYSSIFLRLIFRLQKEYEQKISIVYQNITDGIISVMTTLLQHYNDYGELSCKFDVRDDLHKNNILREVNSQISILVMK